MLEWCTGCVLTFAALGLEELATEHLPEGWSIEMCSLSSTELHPTVPERGAEGAPY